MKKRKKIIIGIVVVFLVIGIFGSFFGSDDAPQSDPSSHGSEQNIKPTQSVADTESNSTEQSSKPDFPASIDDVDISFASSIHDDTTGNWRLSRVATQKDTKDYALDYYKHFFSNNDEIHWIVNFTLNTTTSIRCVSGQLFVDEYDYVKGEELSAKKIGSGNLLAEYSIDIASGKTEKLQ